MTQTTRLTFLLLLALAVAPTAQTQPVPDARVGDNVNVLAVDRTDYLKGDFWGQRQQEPQIGVSSVNPSHLVVFYNDFRGVEFGAGERPLPPQTSTLFARTWNQFKGFLARVMGRPPTTSSEGRTRNELGEGGLVASAEAWIGWSVSYDAGISWIGGMMPGGPGDSTNASTASPAYGFEGASDPVVMSAPCGKFYVAWLAFTRADSTTPAYQGTRGKSALLVSRFQDLNNSDSQHTIQYQGTTLIETGQNATNGHFLDKPEGAVKLIPGRTCGQVTEEVTVTYTTFVGKGQTFVSKVNVALSVDGGLSFKTGFADDSYQQSQGTAVTVANGVTYLFWRSFYSPDTIVWTRTNSRGQWAKPADLLAGEGMNPYDQPMLSAAEGAAFRANGFPSATATPDGSYVFVAWHERDASGNPTIMVKQFATATETWSAKTAIPGQNAASPFGQGFFNPGPTTAGPRVMASVACAAGNRCLLSFFEARSAPLSAGQWISGLDQVLDYRGVMLTPGPSFGAPFQISRYGYEPPATKDGPTWDAFLRALEGGLLDSDPDQYALQVLNPFDGGRSYPSLNWANYTHTGGGSYSFMGDYNSATPLVQYVTNGSTWQLATDPALGDAFVTAWADNRNVVPPVGGPSVTPWDYSPPGAAQCTNPGSRDQSVMLATVSPSGLLLTAPYTFKPISGVTEFPLTIWNNTGDYREFDVDLVGNASASFSPETSCSALECGPGNEFSGPLRTGLVRINAYSSSSLYVYVTAAGEFGVTAKDRTSGVQRNITFNRVTAPNPNYTTNNPTVTVATANPVPKNPVPKNPVPKNPVPKNSYPGEIISVQDYEVTIEPGSSGDVGSYLTLFNVDQAYQDAYVFQVFLTKPTYAFEVDGNCQVANRVSGTLLTNISDPTNPVPKNPVPKNPVPKNPVPKNPVPKNSVPPELFQNSTFTMGELAGTGGSGGVVETYSCSAKNNLIGGNCTKHASRQKGKVIATLRAYQVRQTDRPYNPVASPPSFFVAESSCTTTSTGCTFVQDGPELVVDKTVAGVSPREQRAGLPVQFPAGGVTVTNVGNRDAQPHQVSFYISKASEPYGDPASPTVLPRTSDGRIREDSSPGRYTKKLEGTIMISSSTGPGGGYTIPETPLRIPTDIPRGADGTALYYVYAYVDSERVVSERDEQNNIVQGDVDLTTSTIDPIKVLAPGYGFLGLQTPCSGFTCDKAGAIVLAWQFTNGAVAVDSVSSLPRLRFFQGCPVPTPSGSSSYSPPLASQALLLTSDPNPTDLTSGNSGWQYFPNTGMTRPQYTWQYNFSSSAGLASGLCYAMYIEIPSTGQCIDQVTCGLATADPALKPFGPFHVTPK